MPRQDRSTEVGQAGAVLITAAQRPSIVTCQELGLADSMFALNPLGPRADQAFRRLIGWSAESAQGLAQPVGRAGGRAGNA